MRHRSDKRRKADRTSGYKLGFNQNTKAEYKLRRRSIKKLCAAKDNVLIISPPGGGKTTFLRECIRAISSSGVRVAVCDERGELAAVFRGVPQFDIGPMSDVMTDIPKSEAALMLLRSMNPQVIAMDEISSPEDCRAAASAVGCGVRVIATAHAAAVSDLKRRNVYRFLWRRMFLIT